MRAGAYAVSSYALYDQYHTGNGVSRTSDVSKASAVSKVNDVSKANEVSKTRGECQTCKERTYVDGSNEANVSFQTPGHISPESSAAVVTSHENEHVRNAVREGNEPGNRLIRASVTLKMAVCPECHKSYVAGGNTTTTIEYSESPYDQGRKLLEGSFLAGGNVDVLV